MTLTAWASILLILLWGLNWPAAATALQGIPPISFRVITLALGGGCLVLYCAVRGISLRVRRADGTRLAIAALLNVVAWNLLSVYAIVALNSGRAAIIAFTMPLWTAAIQLSLGMHPSRRQWCALGIGAVGVLGLVISAALDATFSVLGAVAMLAAAFTWACGSVYVQRRPIAMPSEAATAWMLIIGSAVVALFLPLQEAGVKDFQPDLSTWLACAYTVFIGMALCQAMWFSLLKSISALSAGLILLGIPPVGVLSGWWLNSATVSLLDIASLGFLLTAGYIALPGSLSRSAASFTIPRWSRFRGR